MTQDPGQRSAGEDAGDPKDDQAGDGAHDGSRQDQDEIGRDEQEEDDQPGNPKADADPEHDQPHQRGALPVAFEHGPAVAEGFANTGIFQGGCPHEELAQQAEQNHQDDEGKDEQEGAPDGGNDARRDRRL